MMQFKEDTWYSIALVTGTSVLTRSISYDQMTQSFTVLREDPPFEAVFLRDAVIGIFEESDDVLDELKAHREEMAQQREQAEKDMRAARVAGMRLN